jgi:hypothetical protein
MNNIKIIATKEEVYEIMNFAISLNPTLTKHLNSKNLENYTVTDWNDTLIPPLKAFLDESQFKLSISGDSLKNLFPTEIGPKNITLFIICLFILHETNNLDASEKETLKNVTNYSAFIKIQYIQKALAIVNKSEQEIFHDPPNKTIVPPKSKKFNFIVPVFSLALIIFVFISIMNKRTLAIDKNDFSIKFDRETLSDSNNTLNIKYDISNIKYDSAFIDFGFDTPKIKLTNPKGELNHTFTMAAGRDAKLIIDTFEFSYYLPMFSENYIGFIDQYRWEISSKDIKKSENFHIEPSLVPKAYLEKGSYLSGYQKLADFKIDGDDFTLKAKIKNDPAEGGLPAYDCSIDVNGITSKFKKGVLFFNLLDVKAKKYLKLNVGETKNGIFYEDEMEKTYGKPNCLDSLAVDTKEWFIVKAVTKDKTLYIYVEDRLKHKVEYKGNVGMLTFLQIGFLGTGSIDWIEMIDNKTRVKFREDF